MSFEETENKNIAEKTGESKRKEKMESRVADYDQYSYDYTEYWKGRDYENVSEGILIEKMLEGESGKRFIDVGGSFGRLTKHYYRRFQECVIVDYSLKTLKANEEELRSHYPNLILIAANAYKLPFKQRSFDFGMMVRVLHHIEDPEKYIKEISQTINNGGKYIQDIPNKVHLKAAIKAILRLDFKFFSEASFEQPTTETKVGTKEEKGIFFNYHTKMILKTLEKYGLHKIKKVGCSYLRSSFLKKNMPLKTMVKIESFLQNNFSWSDTAPLILVKNELVTTDATNNLDSKFEEILCCPECKGALKFNTNEANCSSCNLKFRKDGNIWDFRAV